MPMPAGRGRTAKRKDMLLIWTERCAAWYRHETGDGCDSCPDLRECEYQADKRINRMFQGGRGRKR